MLGQRIQVSVIFLLSVLLSNACVVHRKGTIKQHSERIVVEQFDGKMTPLILLGGASPLKFLEGYLVDLQGKKLFNQITVERWRVIQGLHGLTVWTGFVEKLGGQIGLRERTGGIFLQVNESAEGAFAGQIGRLVLVEGYIEGANQIHVVYYRNLTPERDQKVGEKP